MARLRGIINPAAASYVDRAISTAEADGAALFVLEMDTPGGLDSSMRLIVQRILASTVPVDFSITEYEYGPPFTSNLSADDSRTAVCAIAA